MKKMLLLGAIALTPIIAAAHSGEMEHMMGSGGTMPPKMGSGMMMSPELQGLHMAMGKLSATDKATLITMIKDYLTSKGISIEAMKEVRQEIKEARKETREGIKETRKTAQEAIKAKREEMKNKIKELRGKKPSMPPSGSGSTMSGGTL